MELWLLILALALIFLSGAPLYAVMIAATALTAIYGPEFPRPFSEEFGGALLTTQGANIKPEAAVFATIPMFIYAGYIMAASKTSDRLVRFANALMGWMPGGLAIVTIFACAIFTIFTGASGVTIVALGALVMPSLLKQKYPERFSIGLVAGTGSVGLLFPPALPLFVFGTVYGLQASALKDQVATTPEEAQQMFADPSDAARMADAVRNWDTERFIFAGIVPGLILIGCIAVVAIAAAMYWKVPRQRFDASELVKSFVAVLPEILLPLIVLVPLINAWANITQLAAVTVVYLVILEMFVYRDITVKTLWQISLEALALIGTIFLIVYTSTALTNALYTAKVPQELVAWAKTNVESKIVFLLMLNLLLLVVGMMMDIFSAVLIVVPLVAPVAYYYGIDPYHLGVIFLLNLEIGYLTPPVGLNLFIASFKFQRPVPEVVRAVLPFMGAMIVALIIVTYVPALTVVPAPKRVGTVASLQALVQEGVELAGSVTSVTLANGTVVQKAECEALPGSDDRRDLCLEMLIAVQACRDKADAKCEQDRLAVYQLEVVGLTELTLPGGALLKVADCEKVPEDDRETCTDLFPEIVDCRKRAVLEGATLGKECEDEALATYVEAMGPTGLVPQEAEEEDDDEEEEEEEE